MSTQQEVDEALRYLMNLTAGREGGPDPSAQALEIIYRHLDDKGDELVAKRKQQKIAALSKQIVDLEAIRDELQNSSCHTPV